MMNLLKNKSLLILVAFIPVLYACPKQKMAIPPEQDKELQSSIDAVFATFLVSDIEMICSHIAENDYSPAFYIPQPLEDQSRFQAFNSPSFKYYTASYNNVKCMDGKLRHGSIFMNYINDNPNSTKYHNYQFHGKMTLTDYRVDGWLIKTVDDKPCDVTNELQSPIFDPNKYNLVWKIKGSFEFIHPTDPSKNMLWSGELTKTLANTNDPAVFNPTALVPINWSKAIVYYGGKATGFTSANIPFEMTVNEYFPITREFTCYPDEFGGIETISPLQTWKNEFHPFISGKIDFETGEKYPREIYLGNEGNSNSQTQCDNKGIVLIKGNSYAVDFN